MSEDNLHKGAHPKLFAYARENRKRETEAEKFLWERLRNRKLHGFKFRRQHPVDEFIADFFCLPCNLVIELDGPYHQYNDQAGYDKGRTYMLNELGVRVIRFTNTEVLENIDFVLEEIKKHLDISQGRA